MSLHKWAVWPNGLTWSPKSHCLNSSIYVNSLRKMFRNKLTEYLTSKYSDSSGTPSTSKAQFFVVLCKLYMKACEWNPRYILHIQLKPLTCIVPQTAHIICTKYSCGYMTIYQAIQVDDPPKKFFVEKENDKQFAAPRVFNCVVILKTTSI